MAKEIKRKYLVDIKDFNKIVGLSQDNKLSIKQCYLQNAKNLVIRLRLQNSINEEKAFIKIKGKTIGITELEYEYEIPYIEALEMIVEFGEEILSKTRYFLNYNEVMFKIDVFEGNNEGLIIAKVELKNEKEQIVLPNWIGEEISLDKRYFNNNLLKGRFNNWI